VVLLAFFIVKYYNCLILDFSSLPDVIAKSKKVFFLYGSGVCGSCPPGKTLLALKDKTDLLFIVPDDFTDIDMYNLKDVFMLKGKIIKGNREVIDFLKKISSCKKFEGWKYNIYIEIKEDGSISRIMKI
jgi:hypothetical protein